MLKCYAGMSKCQNSELLYNRNVEMCDYLNITLINAGIDECLNIEMFAWWNVGQWVAGAVSLILCSLGICSKYIKPVLTAVCVFLWLFRWPAQANSFPHRIQLWGFIPECIIMCLFRQPYSINTFPQILNKIGPCSLCIIMWIFLVPHVMHLFSHCPQTWGFFTLWMMLCFFILTVFVKV